MNDDQFVPLIDVVRHDPRALQYMASKGFVVIARQKRSGKTRQVPLRSLLLNNPNFFRINTSYDYLVSEESAREIERVFPPDTGAKNHTASAIAKKSPTASKDAESEKASNSKTAEGRSSHSDAASQQPAQASGPVKPPNFGRDYERIAAMDPFKRSELIGNHGNALKELTRSLQADPKTVSEALTNATAETALANKATVQEALRMSNAEAQRYSASMVAATESIMDSTALLLDSNLYNEELLSHAAQISNGTVIQHMTRVFLMGFSFLLYYNYEYNNCSLASKVRGQFNRKYKQYYRQLLPHLEAHEISLQNVFYGGMRPLTMEEIRTFAMGFLVHDIGKAEDIEYHEGEEGYDYETVARHVAVGYKAVMEKTVYPRQAALITGYHHEYYGAPSGYGYFRELLQKYKTMNPEAKIDHVMSYEMEPLIDYQVLAYFPAKVLEIIDVFDSLTDPQRLYRTALKPQEAIDMLHKEFVSTHFKVDPILLDLFERFANERGILGK